MNARKRERSVSPDEAANELYYVYEFKRKTLRANFNLNEKEDEYFVSKREKSKKLQRLFDICLTFIANHIEYVESFIDFPSQVGVLIFQECLQVGRFEFNSKNTASEERPLSLFAQAYPEYFSESVNLDSNPTLFTHLSNVLKHCAIKRLDLSDCDLTAAVNLNDLLQGSLHSLQVLNLSKNNLDHDFLKKFTLPLRLSLADNFPQLQTIDLRDNHKLTPQCVQYFCNYKSLAEILLSIDKLKEYKFSNENKFRVCNCKLSEDHVKIANSGWLKDVLQIAGNMSHRKTNLATKEYNEYIQEIRNCKASSTSALSFYNKTTPKPTSSAQTSRYETKRFRVKCDKCGFKQVEVKRQPATTSAKTSTIKSAMKIDDELLKMYL